MEHPLLFLVLLADKVGLGEFAHHYPHVLYSWLVVLVLIILGRLATSKVEFVPRGLQNLFEVFIEGFENFQVELMGEHGRRYFPLIATIFLYIFSCNMLGLIPGMLSSTANVNTTLSVALVTFTATHYLGIKYHGFKYIKHFTGPHLPLALAIPIGFLMFIIEIISHLSRILSLTLRLFGNIMGEDLVLAILFVLAGLFLAPLPMMGLAIFTSLVQAFVFSLLSMLYLAGSIHEAH